MIGEGCGVREENRVRRRKNCESAVEGNRLRGAAGGRPSYAANPRQPHSITMLSQIQMTVISFGTPYT